MDPELTMALRVSMAKEDTRQERVAAAEGGSQEESNGDGGGAATTRGVTPIDAAPMAKCYCGGNRVREDCFFLATIQRLY